jgi:hypothetical protein
MRRIVWSLTPAWRSFGTNTVSVPPYPGRAVREDREIRAKIRSADRAK